VFGISAAHSGYLQRHGKALEIPFCVSGELRKRICVFTATGAARGQQRGAERRRVNTERGLFLELVGLQVSNYISHSCEGARREAEWGIKWPLPHFTSPSEEEIMEEDGRKEEQRNNLTNSFNILLIPVSQSFTVKAKDNAAGDVNSTSLARSSKLLSVSRDL